jgi:hypothetical protein
MLRVVKARRERGRKEEAEKYDALDKCSFFY